MKKFIILLCLPVFSFSQADSLEYISKTNFKKVHDAFLTGAMIGDDKVSSLGSFVSIDIAKPNVTLALSKNWLKHKEIDVIGVTSLKFTGGITDGISSIFEDEKFNSNINFRLEHNFPIRAFTSMKFIADDAEQLRKEKAKIKTTEKDNKDYKELLKLEISELEKSKTELTATQKKNYYESKEKLAKLESIKFKKKLDKLDLEAKWSTVRAGWLNVFSSYGVQKIRLYDTSESLANQINKIEPDNYEFGLGLNFYYNQRKGLGCNIKNHWANIFNGLYSITYSFAKTNNTSALSSDKIVTETQIAQENNESQFIENSVNAYVLDSYDTFKRHKIAININKKIINNLHLHMFYDYNEIKESDKYNGNYQNLGLGIILGLRKKDDTTEKTYVNFEPFILFKDLTDKFEGTGDQFYKRSLVGIRTTIPFDNLLKK